MMTRTLFVLFGILIALPGQAEVIDIDSTQLDQLRRSGVPVIDIRLTREWEETGIVPGSHLLTFFDERGQYDARGWLTKVQGISKPGSAIAVICRTGNRTKPVSQFLDQQGYTKVYNVKHGIKRWIADGGEVVSAAAAVAQCRAAKTC